MVTSSARHPSVRTPREATPVATSKAETSNRDPVLVDFALQDGGAHGAFTWGALDRLLEEPSLQIDGVQGHPRGQ